MNINATLVGEFMLVFVPLVGALSYYLGRRKTQTPFVAALLGMMFSLVPPCGLVYLLVLVLKKDVAPVSVSE